MEKILIEKFYFFLELVTRKKTIRIKLLTSMIGVFLLMSCSSDANQAVEEPKRKLKKSAYLIDWSTEFVFSDGPHADNYYSKRDSFIKPYKKYNVIEDTLYVSTLFEINSCRELIGDIEIKSDTIYLGFQYTGDEACASDVYHVFNYVICIPEIEKYIISY